MRVCLEMVEEEETLPETGAELATFERSCTVEETERPSLLTGVVASSDTSSSSSGVKMPLIGSVDDGYNSLFSQTRVHGSVETHSLRLRKRLDLGRAIHLPGNISRASDKCWVICVYVRRLNRYQTLRVLGRRS